MDRSYDTYQSRLRASIRLQRLADLWNFVLVSTTTAAAVASVITVRNPRAFGEDSDVLLACISVALLALSLTVTQMNYSARSRDMTSSYLRAQDISLRAERLASISYTGEPQGLLALEDEYKRMLSTTENHSPRDYWRYKADNGTQVSRTWRLRFLQIYLIPMMCCAPGLYLTWRILNYLWR